MINLGWKAVIGVGMALGIWILKTVANANDPDRQRKKEIWDLKKKRTKYIKVKKIIEEKIAGTTNEKEIINLHNRLSAILLELARVHKKIRELA